MTELDPRGLEAAAKALSELDSDGSVSWTAYAHEAAGAIRAYLAVTTPAGDLDRIAVVVNADGGGVASIVDHHELSEVEWRDMEADAFGGPFVRAIVECRLPRPAEPVTVRGRVTG